MSTDFGNIFGEVLKQEILKNIQKQNNPPQESNDNYASQQKIAEVERQHELDRRYYLRTAVQLMADPNMSDGMNYDWKDLLTLAEKIRAYIEGGVCVTTDTAWRGIRKIGDDSETTLGS